MSTYDNAAPPRRASVAPASWIDRLALGMQDPLLLLSRLLLGAIFVQSGFGKLTNLDGFIANLTNQGVPAPSAFGVIGACVEFFGGLAIVLGAWTRAAAVLMVVFTAIATLISHRYWAAAEAQRVAQHVQFMKNLAIIGGFVGLIAAGAGRFSVDGFRGRGRG